MSLFSPLLVICLDQEQVNASSELAKELGFPDAHVVAGGFADAIHALSLRTSSPEHMLINIGQHTDDILPALDEFAQHCESNVRVVVTGATNDIDFYRELKQRGVLEYFTHPANPDEVAAILVDKASNAAKNEANLPKGKVISCISAASGDGSSTVALNLAYCLATEYKQPTVLVDMDYQFGLICKSLDLAAPFGIREIFDDPERGLDGRLVSKMLVNYRDHLQIVSAPSELRLLPNIRPEVVRELITILRSKFRFVVIDVPHVWTDWTAATLTYSDHVMMVGQLWLRSLTHASRLLAAWQKIGVDKEHISIVINRSGAKFKEAIDNQDFERICRRKIDVHIDNDVKAVTQAENNAHTLFEGEQSTVLRQQISDMARKLILRYGDTSSLPADKLNEPKKGLLSFPNILKGGA
ncbi:MAG: AAA family ATPase [Rickettsiales bacterium]